MDSRLLAVDDDWLKKFILLILTVPLLNCLNGICTFLALTKHNTIQTHLNPIPPLIPIHNIVPPHYRRNLSHTTYLLNLLQQLSHIPRSTLRIRIPPIPKEMNVNLRHTHLLRDLQQAEQMQYMTMHTAVTDQAQEM